MTAPLRPAGRRAREQPTIGSISRCPHCAGERVLVDDHAVRVWECGTCTQVEIEVVYLVPMEGPHEMPSAS